MVTIQVKNIEGKTVLPVAGSELAAGYDIIAVDDPIIVGESITKEGEFFPFWKRIDYIEYHTALHISPQTGEKFVHHNREFFHTLLHPRSSVRKYNLVLANSIGLVDNDYRGEIICCFKYIWQPEDFIMESVNKKQEGELDDRWEFTGQLIGKLNRERIYKKGDKIAQLVTEKTNPTEYVLVSELDATERGAGGFGSTDAKPKVVIQETTVVEPPKPKVTPKQEPRQSVMHQEERQEKGSFGSIVDQYQKAGGVPIKKRYIDEIKERQGGNNE